MTRAPLDRFVPAFLQSSVLRLPHHLQALLRHVAHPHPALRAHLLLLVGKLRLRRLESAMYAQASSSSEIMTTSADVNATAAEYDDGAEGAAPRHGSTSTGGDPPKTSPHCRRLKSAAAAALTAALRVSFSRGGHDWRVLSGACMGLVVLYVTTAANLSSRAKSLAEDEDRTAAKDGTIEDTGAYTEQEVNHWLQGHAWSVYCLHCGLACTVHVYLA